MRGSLRDCDLKGLYLAGRRRKACTCGGGTFPVSSCFDHLADTVLPVLPVLRDSALLSTDTPESLLSVFRLEAKIKRWRSRLSKGGQLDSVPGRIRTIKGRTSLLRQLT